MSPRPKRGWFSRSVAAFVSAAVVVSAFGPGAAAAAEIESGSASESSHVRTAALGSPLSAPSPLSIVALAPLAPLSVHVALSAPAAVSAGVSAAPIAPIAASAVGGGAASAAASASGFGGHDRPEADAAAAAAPEIVAADAPSLESARSAAAADGALSRAAAWIKRATRLESGAAAGPAETPVDDGESGRRVFDGAAGARRTSAGVLASAAPAASAAPLARAGTAATPAPTVPPAPNASAAAAPDERYLHEDFLGFRSVRGIARAPELGRLPSDANSSRIIDHIAGQFGLKRADVLELARGFRMDEASPRASWLAVYDRLQAANRERFKRLDSRKYSGAASFRRLANISYAPGWRGVLQRAAEVHKLVVGFTIRFPYHLFDMFLFGYFRQAISFEFFHSTEDFLTLKIEGLSPQEKQDKDLAKKWLEAALRQQSLRGEGTFGRLRANASFRELERWFLTPLARPLATFVARRLTLAILSAVAMGLLGAFAPVLPLSFSLTAIPVLGPGLVWGLNGLPVVAGAVPFVGHFLAPVVAAAAGALARDLVLGPLLNTWILATLLTFPSTAREFLARSRERHPSVALTAGEWFGAFGRAAVSGEFWKSNLKTFLGLATVGAEIEGIMTYAHAIDSVVDPGFQSAHKYGDRNVGFFETLGSAVERPAGQSAIPFGGAITWGNVLLYKLQDLSGFHVSEAVMGAALTVKSGLGFEDAAHAGAVKAPAAAIVSAAEARPGSKLPFDPDLWQKSEADVVARIKALAAGDGGLDAELTAVKARMTDLRGRLGDAEARKAALEKISRPLTPEEKAEYASRLKELESKRESAYVLSKLSEKRDLTTPTADGLSQLRRLDGLLKEYGPLLPPPPTDKSGYLDQIAAREASYKALVSRLENPGTRDAGLTRSAVPTVKLSPEKQREIEDLVKKIEQDRAAVKAELAQREATQGLIQAANKIRNHALSERRNGQDMLRFHTDFAKLDTVVDLALSLNEIAAAQAAIAKMQQMLSNKTTAINAAQQQNQQNLAANQALAAQQAQWQAQATQTVNLDKADQASLAGQQTEAQTAVTNIGSFQTTISNFIAMVNAQDKGQSANAAAEYARRLALLPQAAQWATSGNPNNSSAFSLATFQADLTEVQNAMTQAQAGLAKIPTVPVEFAGVLVIAVPGSAPGQPNPTVTNPTQAEVLQILAARKTGWQAELALKQSFLNQVNGMMDPNNAATTTDVFGNVTPVSLPRWLTQTQADMSAKQTTAKQLLSQLDQTAAQINAATGSSLPMLSGLTLTQLQTAIQNYPTQLEAVKFPNDGSVATFQAKMALISAAQNVPPAARAIVQWSQDQATVTAIQSAMSTTLPQVQQSLQSLVNMVNSILADIQLDVNFVNTGQGGGQALINRKTALLQSTIIPALQQAQTMLTGTLIPYQQSTIASYASNSTGSYYTLFTAEQTLLTDTNNLFNNTVPWAIVTQGAPTGNNAAALANIASFKQTFLNYMNGYTDSAGVHEGITQYQKDMADRQCATGCSRTEVLYGETQPYSLPMKISQYGAEMTQRASQINTEDAQINSILQQIQTLSNGQYNLSVYMLPTGVGTDPGSVAKIQAVVNASLIPNLGTMLTNIGKQAQAAGGSTTITIAGGNGTVPVGKQPSPTISTNQQIAILALNAAQRLVPSSVAQPSGAPAAYAVARYLYSNSVVTAAQSALTTQVPQAVTFLNTAAKALNDAIADTNIDVSYVNSNGTNATPAAVYARKIAIFGELNSFLGQAVSFYAMKQGWDQQAFSTITSVNTYYTSLSTIYSNGVTVDTNELNEINTMSAALQTELNSLNQTQAKVLSWMAQLDPNQQSALRNVADDVTRLQDKTRAVLEANINWHQLQDDLQRSQAIVKSKLTQIDGEQQTLSGLLANPDVQNSLSPDLVNRIEALRLGHDAWALGGTAGSTQAIVVKKSDFSSFLDAMLGLMTGNSQNLANQDLGSLKSSLLANPQGLSSFIPGASIMQFGDNADGFYLVYQSNFSVPNGLQTGTWVTLGNVAHVWGNNVSVNSYEFTSPPSSGGQNAPFGDKGVEMQVESLQGENWVNYLNVDLHRFGFDIPTNNSPTSTLSPSRLMIFDDYAVMLLNNRLYVGLAGYGDFAMNQPGDNPYFYGGNVKTSFKMNDVMSMDASQQALFIKDPRSFLETVNLNFTGYDPSLNQDFVVTANGDNKYYSRTQVGPTFDVNRLLNPNGGGDSFTVSLFGAETRGTDDIQQGSLGTTVIKGFSIKNDQGKTWLQINNSATAELGQQANTLGDQLSFTLPDKGITLSAQGQIIGGASDYYASLSKKVGDNTAVSLGYGSQYIGMPNRLSLTLNTSFTLAQLWQAVADHSVEDLKGGATLAKFNSDMSSFFGGDAKNASPTVAALSQVYETDVARKLISQDIGTLTRDIQDLRKAGAIMDNTRTRAMVGFTSGSVDNTTADLAVGGGPTVGTYTQLTLTKTQKTLIEDKAASLYREGLRLQDRLIAITKEWQGDVAALAEAQWDVKLANYEIQNAPNTSLRADAGVRLAQAQDRLHQALLNYNALTGRPSTAGSPFAELNADDLQQLMGNIRALIASPDRLNVILGRLDKSELERNLGPNPFNAMDWLPWVDRLSVGFGVQYQDMMNNQVLTLGGSVRLPIYDPASKAANHAYQIESQATGLELEQAYAERAVARQAELDRARAWQASAAQIAPQGPAAAQRLSDAIRQYRNGLIGPDDLRRAFDDWRWYAQATLEASSNASLAAAAAAIDAPPAGAAPLPSDPARVSSFDDAFALAVKNSRSLAEVADRAMAAEDMARAQEHRIQKAWLDLSVGLGLTDTGLGWIPSIKITGIPVTPIFGFEFKSEELRELQVAQHDQQKAYYDALKESLKTGLAIRFYQEVVAYRSAQTDVGLYDNVVLPRLSAGGAARDLDAARVGRERAVAAQAEALAQLNFLLGRAAGAPLEIDMDAAQAFAALQALVKSSDPVKTQERVLDARVEIARAVEGMVDKNLKVQTLQLEPVSIIVRSFGRLIGALGDGPIYDQDKAAAARINTLTEERARQAFASQNADQAQRLRQRLAAAISERERLDPADPLSVVKSNDLDGEILNLRSGLLALGEEPTAAAPRKAVPPANAAAPVGAPLVAAPAPTSWSEMQGRLRQAEQALAPKPATAPPDIPAPDVVDQQRSSAYMRYDYAQQTLGQDPINKGFAEGWIEVRLRDPNTPASVLMSLARLRDEKADRIHDTELAGANVDADVLLAQFQADVRLSRWLAARGDSDAAAFKTLRAEVEARVKAESDRLAYLLGTASGAGLAALVPQGAGDDKGPADLASGLIDDIRGRQIDVVRSTIFSDGGLPDSFGTEDGLMQQIRANTIAERMSYKGFSPVLAAGIFQGTPIQGVFLEAPDPREIQRALESVMSDVLRKQMESDGRMKELSLHLSSLMAQVSDGAKELEARRGQIEAAEADLRARTALATTPDGIREFEASEARLAQAWSDFDRAMVTTKSSFIELVSELQALGEGSTGTLHPLLTPLAPTPTPSLRPDAREALLDFWAERLGDPAFQAAQDAVLAQAGPAVPAELLARLADDARAYQTALRDAEAVRQNDFTASERLDLLARNDLEGKRQAVRADAAEILRGLGGLDPHAGPGAAALLDFMRAQADKAASDGAIDLASRREMLATFRESFWGGENLSPEVAGAFSRLGDRQKAVDDASDLLMAQYLSAKGDKPTDFVLSDLLLDKYLKAERDFDEELARTLESAPFQNDKALARSLDGVFDVRASLARASETAAHGRGIEALNALIMLESTRLRGARWTGRPPQEIDRDASALQSLVDLKGKWEAGSSDLQPLYALTRVGPGGLRTWSVDRWLTPAEYQAFRDQGAIREDGGRQYVDGSKLKDAQADQYEIIGGVDVADALKTGAARALSDNADAVKLYGALGSSDFVLVGAPGGPLKPLSFAQVYGPQGLSETGRLFYFAAPDPDHPEYAQDALSPLMAQSLPPEKVVTLAWDGSGPVPGRDRFPNLQSLRGSAESASFLRLEASADGAAKVVRAALGQKEAQLSRGWIEVKLDSFGFARDSSGRMAQLYTSRDDFEAQWKAFDNAGRDLAAAERALTAAKAAEDAAKLADAKAAKDYDAAVAKLDAARAAAKPALDRANAAADAEKRTIDGVDGPQRGAFGASLRQYQSAPGLATAKKEADPLIAARQKAADKLREASAARANAEKALADAKETLARSTSWTLYRTQDLALGLDAAGDVVRAAARPARGALPLDAAVGGGGPAASTLTGTLAAAVVDSDGRLTKAYRSDADVDAAAQSWRLMSYQAGGDTTPVDARLPDGTVSTKVRFSHYEENGLPVLLSERYLISRVDRATSKLSTANHWAIEPYNWGNILLEVPREIATAPIELFGGRNPNEQHYLGRSYIYKSEGGETDHHGFFRAALGVVDVLDLLPDQATPYLDPSQFPDAVRVNSPLKPGQILADKDPRETRDGRSYDLHYGAGALSREAAAAAEDLAAARQRTLARFNGGIEDVTLKTVHGIGRPEIGPDGKVVRDDVGYPVWDNRYLQSRVVVESGSVRAGNQDEPVAQRRIDGDATLAAAANPDAPDGVELTATPNSLFVDRVARRVRVYPGAVGYDARAAALNGYDARLGERAAAVRGATTGLSQADAQAQAGLAARVSDHDKASAEEDAAWAAWQKIAERKGTQDEIERRLSAVQSSIDGFSKELAWWTKYAAQLQDAILHPPVPNPGPNPNPGPVTPGNPGSSTFWLWVLSSLGLGALLAALWQLLRRASPRPA